MRHRVEQDTRVIWTAETGNFAYRRIITGENNVWAKKTRFIRIFADRDGPFVELFRFQFIGNDESHEMP